MERESNPWTTLSSEQVYEDGFIAVRRNEVRNASGRVTRYGTVRWKKRGVAVLPVDHDGRVYLVGQYRYAADRYSWELPRGGVEPGEDLRAGAQRELEEEIGCTAGRWLDLANFMVSGSITDEHAACCIAWDLRRGEAKPDDSELLRVRRVPFRAALRMAANGDLADVVTSAVILAASAKAQLGELPEDLAALLKQSRA